MARVSKPAQSGDEVFEIRFNPWRDVAAKLPDGSRVMLSSVSKATGTVTRIERDSVTLQLDSWREESPAAEHEAEPGTEAKFPATDREVTFHQSRFSPIKNLVLLGTIVGLVALSIGQASVAGY